jgi:hypothetical protein
VCFISISSIHDHAVYRSPCSTDAVGWLWKYEQHCGEGGRVSLKTTLAAVRSICVKNVSRAANFYDSHAELLRNKNRCHAARQQPSGGRSPTRALSKQSNCHTTIRPVQTERPVFLHWMCCLHGCTLDMCSGYRPHTGQSSETLNDQRTKPSMQSSH